MPTIARAVGVLRSNASVSDATPAPQSVNSRSVVIRSATERPSAIESPVLDDDLVDLLRIVTIMIANICRYRIELHLNPVFSHTLRAWS